MSERAEARRLLTQARAERDAALAERDKWQAETARWAESSHTYETSLMAVKELLTDTQASLREHMAGWKQAESELTEARRVLREVLPVDCEHVHHPKRDQHPFNAACPVLQRAAAVLAQEETR